jgi:hypothetical protein
LFLFICHIFLFVSMSDVTHPVQIVLDLMYLSCLRSPLSCRMNEQSSLSFHTLQQKEARMHLSTSGNCHNNEL